MGGRDGPRRRAARGDRSARRRPGAPHRRHRSRHARRGDAPAQPRALRLRLGAAADEPRRACATRATPPSSSSSRALCQQRNVAVQTIKAIARRRWPDGTTAHARHLVRTAHRRRRHRARRALGARAPRRLRELRRRSAPARPDAARGRVVRDGPTRRGDRRAWRRAPISNRSSCGASQRRRRDGEEAS